MPDLADRPGRILPVWLVSDGGLDL